MKRTTSLASAARAAAAAVAVLALMTPAHAYFDYYLNGTIIGSLSKEQSSAFAKTFRDTLAHSPDGQSVSFSLPADKRGKATEGTLTIVQSKMDGSQQCRKMRSEMRQEQRSEKWEGWYCKQASGQWKGRAVKE